MNSSNTYYVINRTATALEIEQGAGYIVEAPNAQTARLIVERMTGRTGYAVSTYRKPTTTY